MLPSHVKEALGESAAIIALSSFANFSGLMIVVHPSEPSEICNLPSEPSELPDIERAGEEETRTPKNRRISPTPI
jgi:hypothetical protein